MMSGSSAASASAPWLCSTAQHAQQGIRQDQSRLVQKGFEQSVHMLSVAIHELHELHELHYPVPARLLVPCSPTHATSFAVSAAFKPRSNRFRMMLKRHSNGVQTTHLEDLRQSLRRS